MYGLPFNFDGSFFVGRTLEQICFNQNQVCFHFDDDLSITIESAFSFKTSNIQKELQIINVPVSSSDLMMLLGAKISEVQQTKNGTLSLKFEDGRILECFDTSEQFESYHIKYKETLIVV